jgi:hypothetical protein
VATAPRASISITSPALISITSPALDKQTRLPKLVPHIPQPPKPPPSAKLPPPSVEQARAIEILRDTRHNITIEACAGSGKTTTILLMAEAAPKEEFLVLVYNRRLMIETTERVQALGLKNVTVLNYHTLGTTYYTLECSTDQGLKRVVEEDMKVLDGKTLPKCSVVVLDEQQDMTPILKRFLDKVFRDMGFAGKGKAKASEPRVVVLGDRRQEMYGFNNADSRFLTLASEKALFGYLNDQPWESADQPTSNRITQQNVAFINEQLLKPKPPLVSPMYGVRKEDEAGNPFPKPRYVICDLSDHRAQHPFEEVMRLLQECKLQPSEILILAPSVRVRAAAIHLANRLALNRIPIHVANSDETEVSPLIAKGKILLCTYHQAKGIEREAAVIFGVDEGYHTYYNRVSEPPKAVTNPQYVANTRAKTHLVLLHGHRSRELPFVDMSTLEQTADVIKKRPLSPEQEEKRGTPQFAVTSLTRNLPETLSTECLQHLNIEMIAPPAYPLGPHPPTEVKDNYGLLEGVSNITGTAIPAIYEGRSRGTCTAFSGVFNLLKDLEESDSRWSSYNPLNDLPPEYTAKLRAIATKKERKIPLDESDYLFLSNLHDAKMNGLLTRNLSIPLDGYDWLTAKHADDVFYTLRNSQIPAKGVKYEKMIKHKFENMIRGDGDGILLAGSLDICHLGDKSRPPTVWEVKNTSTLQAEHVLQVALYMQLLKAISPGQQPPEGYLLSASSGQMFQISPKTEDSFMVILQKLFDIKTGGNQTKLLNAYSNQEFLEEAHRGFSNLVGPVALPVEFSMKPKGMKMSPSSLAAVKKKKALEKGASEKKERKKRTRKKGLDKEKELVEEESVLEAPGVEEVVGLEEEGTAEGG